jgi:hypothetical protein
VGPRRDKIAVSKKFILRLERAVNHDANEMLPPMSLEEKLTKIRDSPKLQGQQQVLLII